MDNFSPYMDFGMGNFQQNNDMNDIYKDSMFNPIMQYEQAYCYYKYLCMQMDYKIKCKEYEHMCNNSNNSNNSHSNTQNSNERINNRRVE